MFALAALSFLPSLSYREEPVKMSSVAKWETTGTQKEQEANDYDIVFH